MFSWLKKQFKRAWNFVKSHFHKAVAVVGAGAVMCTLEITGLYVADIILLPLAMSSLIGLIALCFTYFLVIFSSITIGMKVFEFLWDKCDLTKKTIIEPETTDTEPTIEPDPDFSNVSASDVVAAMLSTSKI